MAAASASSAASVVLSRGKQGYHIPIVQKFRYATTRYVHTTHRDIKATKATTAVDASVGEKTMVLFT